MSQNHINTQFQQYASTLYSIASKMIDKRNPQYEDKVQDLVILAYEEFKRKSEQGIIMSLPLLINFMKFRKKEIQLEMRGYSRTHKKDIFNKRNYYEGKYELYSLDNSLNDELIETFADNLKDEFNIEDEISFQIDLRNKFVSLRPPEILILQMKINGYNNNEISQIMSIEEETVRNSLEHIQSIIFDKKPIQYTFQF